MGLLDDFKFGRKNEREVDLTLRSVEVVAGVRRLRATWTPEMAENMERYHNLDAEEELTRMLSEEISREIDERLIRRIRRIAEDIIPVQPMEEPMGRLFFLDSNYRHINIDYFKFGR